MPHEGFIAVHLGAGKNLFCLIKNSSKKLYLYISLFRKTQFKNGRTLQGTLLFHLSKSIVMDIILKIIYFLHLSYF